MRLVNHSFSVSVTVPVWDRFSNRESVVIAVSQCLDVSVNDVDYWLYEPVIGARRCETETRLMPSDLLALKLLRKWLMEFKYHQSSPGSSFHAVINLNTGTSVLLAPSIQPEIDGPFSKVLFLN